MACGDNPTPAQAAKPITSTAVEPAGAHCANGGIVTSTGLDTNANGVLDPSEVTSYSYTCSHDTLLRQDPIASGAVCPGGGVDVQTGHDLNDDGTLEDSEIENTTTVCYSDELYQGDLKTSDFATADAQEKLSHVRVVTGNLRIDSAVALPNLTVVGGNLELRIETLVELPALGKVIGSLIGPPAAVVIGEQNPPRGVMLDAPALTQVGGSVSMTSWTEGGRFIAPALSGVDGELDVGGKMSAVDLGKLNHVGLNLGIELTEPTALALPALDRVGMGVRIGGQSTDLAFPVLRTAGYFQILHSNLRSLALPLLTSISTLTIYNSASLASVAMPSLSAVTTVSLSNLPALTSFDLGEVSALDGLNLTRLAITDLGMFSTLRSIKKISIASNPQLASLGGFDQLTTVTDLTISNNPALVSLAGLDQLAKLTGNLTIQHDAALTSLSELGALTNVAGVITISDDAALPASEIAAFLTRLGR